MGDIDEYLTKRLRLTAGAFYCVVETPAFFSSYKYILTAGAFYCVVETPRPPGDVYLFVIILSVLISRLLLLFVIPSKLLGGNLAVAVAVIARPERPRQSIHQHVCVKLLFLSARLTPILRVDCFVCFASSQGQLKVLPSLRGAKGTIVPKATRQSTY
jgi:hypothetical protein